jgi:biofilm PGA synthesis N-glycosyltransferase PgaC
MPQLPGIELTECPTLTIAIPSLNEKNSIWKKLENTFSVEYPIPFEVIVVDDSNDGTLEIVKDFMEEHRLGNRLKMVRLADRMGKAHALNAALSLAQGELFVETDANALFDKRSLVEIVRPFMLDAKVGCVSGARTVPAPQNLYERGESIYWMIDTFIRGIQSKYSNIRTSIGELSAYRTKLLRQIGGFPVAAVSEDFEMTLLLAARGYKISLSKEARVSEPAPSTLSDLYDRKARITYGLLKGLWANKTLMSKMNTGFVLIAAMSVILPCVAAISFPVVLFLCLARVKGFAFLLGLGLVGLTILVVFGRNWFKDAAIFCLYALIVFAAILGGIFRFIFTRQKLPWKKLESTRK